MPNQHDHLSFPILIGDIGGTNARFCILLEAGSEPVQLTTVKTADYASIDDAIRSAILDKTSVKPVSTLLAVAGPIESDEIPLTNCHWIVKPKDMLAKLGLSDVIVINDFEAQALAIAALGDDNRERIGPERADMMASRVVLGPGTGLGVAGLVYARNMWFPVPGEGGHVDIGPRSARDYQVFPHLEAIEGRIAGEQILCGRGLVNLYRAICTTDGVSPAYTDPADITANGLNGANAQAQETLSLFSTYLGRIAGDMALIFMARGGVYLAGGISQKIIPALKLPEFRAAFEDKAPHKALMASIPTYVVTHPQAALAGLSTYARSPSNFGVTLDGRRWQR